MKFVPRPARLLALVLMVAALGLSGCGGESQPEPPAPPAEDAITKEDFESGEVGGMAVGTEDESGDDAETAPSPP